MKVLWDMHLVPGCSINSGEEMASVGAGRAARLAVISCTCAQHRLTSLHGFARWLVSRST
jgi:hypothetical protein